MGVVKDATGELHLSQIGRTSLSRSAVENLIKAGGASGPPHMLMNHDVPIVGAVTRHPSEHWMAAIVDSYGHRQLGVGRTYSKTRCGVVAVDVYR
jgi:hypothetical protein